MQRNNLKIRLHHLTAGVLLLLSGCMDQTVYHSHQPVPACTWEREMPLCFSIDSLVPGNSYTISLQARILQDYPYQQLKVRVEHNLGKGIQNDTLTLQVTDKEGKMLSKQLFFHPISTPAITLTPEQSKGWLKLHHLMRKESLKGVNDMGIQICR